MAPVEIQLIVPKRDPEILWVRSGERMTIKHVKPAELEVYCRDDDKSGVLRVAGPSQAVTVKKNSANVDQNAVTFAGLESLEVSSPFYDEKVIISHKTAVPRGSFGQIPR